MKTRHLLIAVIAIAFALGLPGPAFSQGKDTVRIGVFLPMTGGVAAYGQMEWAGIQVARDMKPTVLGKKVELFLADTKSDKIEAATAMDRLLKKNKVQAVIGEAISGNTMAGAPIADKAKIPVVSPTATNPLVTQNREYIFRVCFIDPFQGEVAAKYAYNTRKARRAALIVDIAQDYCVGLANFFTKSFTKLGGKVVATTYCQTGDQDFTAQLSAIMAAKPDFLGHFAKEAATTDIARKYIAAYEKKTGKEASGFDALGADAYFVILDAMERAKSTDGPKVRAALANTKNFKGVSGVINIGPDGNAVKSMVILQVKDGKFQYLTTVNP
jgi:branched-chain amino acid transport system substrate-binding protein